MKNAVPAMSLIAIVTLLLMGCDSPPPRTPSSAFIKFNPGKQFETLGCTVEQSAGEGRVGTREVYGWRPFRGALVLPDDAQGCEFVANAVHDALVHVLGKPCRDELDLTPDRGRGQPFYGMLRYNNDGMQGFVYVWLFPDASETHINYAILLHEQAPPDSHSI